MIVGRAGRGQSALLIVLAILVVVAGVGGFVGLPSWVVLVAASVPWLFYAWRCWGAALAVTAIVVGNFWALLVLMMATSVMHLPMLPTILITYVVIGLGGVFLVSWLTPSSLGTSASRAVWLSALVGPAVWLASIGLSTVIPGAAKLLWVMSNDQANNLLFARQIIYGGGIAIGSNQNPVPLPTGFLALVMSSGRADVASSELLRHDIVAFVEVWTIVIALLCFFSGLLAAHITLAATDRRPIVVAVGAAGSVVPLSWFFTSYPVDYGFLSAHVALVIILACVVAAIASPARPRIAFGIQCMAATDLLAVWSPLVAIPAMLALVILLVHRRRFWPLRGASIWFPAVGVVQLVLYGLGVALPSFLSLRAFLKAPGGVYDFPHWMLPILACVAVLLAVASFWQRRRVVLFAVVGAAVGALLGLGGLLFLTRLAPDPWTYYPTKYAWIASTIFVIMIMGLLPAVAEPLFRRIGARIAAVGVVVVVAAGIVVMAPPSDEMHTWRQPIVWILAGEVNGPGDEVAEKILAAADLEHPSIYWQSGDPNQLFINFWLLEVAANSMTDSNALRVASYGGYHENKISDLCSLMTTLGGNVAVHTASSSLQSKIDLTCPSLGARVIIER